MSRSNEIKTTQPMTKDSLRAFKNGFGQFNTDLFVSQDVFSVQRVADETCVRLSWNIRSTLVFRFCRNFHGNFLFASGICSLEVIIMNVKQNIRHFRAANRRSFKRIDSLLTSFFLHFSGLFSHLIYFKSFYQWKISKIPVPCAVSLVQRNQIIFIHFLSGFYENLTFFALQLDRPI